MADSGLVEEQKRTSKLAHSFFSHSLTLFSRKPAYLRLSLNTNTQLRARAVMPATARQPSPPPRLSTWSSYSSPMFYPPHLSALLNRTNPLPSPSSLPASRRFKNQSPPPFGSTTTTTATRFDSLQQEIDALEQLEDDHDLRVCNNSNHNEERERKIASLLT